MGQITGAVLCSAILASSGVFSNNGKNRACKYSGQIVKAADKYKLDPYLLTAMIQVESNWNPYVVSHSNACGLTQVLPQYSKYTCEQLKNPKTSIFEGAKKLNFWIYKYGKGDITIGLCGYNKGFRCKGKKANRRGLTYAKKVVKLTASLKPKENN